MKRELLEILCCPVCKGDLELHAKMDCGIEVIEGMLHCRACEADFPIEDGIPDLIPADRLNK